LGAAGPTVAPKESLNNEIGLPVTALRVDAGTRYLVAEMGTRGPGQIAYLADIVAPRVGVVLNIGVAHLGEFGSQDDIAAAKGELVEGLPTDGLAVLNADDPRVMAMAARTAAPVLTFGRSEQAGVRLSRVGLDDDGHTMLQLEWDGRRRDLTLGYYGEHQAMNAAAAVAAALGVGLDLDDVVAALEGVSPSSKWRMDIVTSPDGVLVINDAYNANPDSMRAALTALVGIAERRAGARTFAVLGEMRELGAASLGEHESLGRLAAGLGVSRLVAVGDAARPVHDAATETPGWSGSATFSSEPADALSYLRGELREGDVVLVKASRATGLEVLAAALAAGRDSARRTGGGR
jgi:UDP-N-acetylmuramoyl-tripeptide--D-alanyl-D-alanine ligase